VAPTRITLVAAEHDRDEQSRAKERRAITFPITRIVALAVEVVAVGQMAFRRGRKRR